MKKIIFLFSLVFAYIQIVSDYNQIHIEKEVDGNVFLSIYINPYSLKDYLEKNGFKVKIHPYPLKDANFLIVLKKIDLPNKPALVDGTIFNLISMPAKEALYEKKEINCGWLKGYYFVIPKIKDQYFATFYNNPEVEVVSSMVYFCQYDLVNYLKKRLNIRPKEIKPIYINNKVKYCIEDLRYGEKVKIIEFPKECVKSKICIICPPEAEGDFIYVIDTPEYSIEYRSIIKSVKSEKNQMFLILGVVIITLATLIVLIFLHFVRIQSEKTEKINNLIHRYEELKKELEALEVTLHNFRQEYLERKITEDHLKSIEKEIFKKKVDIVEEIIKIKQELEKSNIEIAKKYAESIENYLKEKLK